MDGWKLENDISFWVLAYFQVQAASFRECSGLLLDASPPSK